MKSQFRVDNKIRLVDGSFVYSTTSDELRISEGHKKDRRSNRYVSGGPFWAVHRRHIVVPFHLRMWIADNVTKGGNVYGGYGIDGNVVNVHGNDWTLYNTLSAQDITSSTVTADADRDGPIGWDKAAPTRNTANVFEFIGNLKKGLPRGIGSASVNSLVQWVKSLWSQAAFFRFIQSIGEDWLNYNFNFRPFLNDLRDMYNTYNALHDRTYDLWKLSHQGVHRRAKVSHSNSSSEVQTFYPNFFGIYGCNFGGTSAYTGGFSNSTVVRTESEYQSWFSGRFHIAVPGGENMLESEWTKLGRNLLQFGALPTPYEVWELIPWSWLIDWFGNVGSNLSNLERQLVDHVVADYAFIMMTRRSTVITTTRLTFPFQTGGRWKPPQNFQHFPVSLYSGPVDLTCVNMVETISKARVRASPYGFGIDWSGLSAYRQSILAALGITRSHF